MDEKKKKWIYYVPILLTAVGGPYAAMSGDAKKLLSSFTSSSTQTSADAMPLYGDTAGYTNSAIPGGVMPSAAAQAGAVGPGLEGPRLEGPTVQDFRQVIRFDVSPRWVAQYWSRVTTVTSELELEGLRVPLVTGGQPSDLAGSLTYYFNKHHTLQRLTFHGVTGDERRLVATLITTFGFKEQPALGGGMYVTTWNGKPSSVLRVQYAPIVSSTAPNAQKQITLEINRPGEFQRLSAEMKELVELDQHVRRW
jgi:hypothetical protein